MELKENSGSLRLSQPFLETLESYARLVVPAAVFILVALRSLEQAAAGQGIVWIGLAILFGALALTAIYMSRRLERSRHFVSTTMAMSTEEAIRRLWDAGLARSVEIGVLDRRLSRIHLSKPEFQTGFVLYLIVFNGELHYCFQPENLLRIVVGNTLKVRVLNAIGAMSDV